MIAGVAESVSKVPDWLGHRARNIPNQIALIAPEFTLTYEQLYDAACHYAASLRKMGVDEGQPVAVLMSNAAHYVLMFHALMQLNAVVVPLNWRLTSHELGRQLSDCKPGVFVYDDPLTDLAAEVIKDQPTNMQSRTFESIEPSSDAVSREDVLLASPHAIVYTSGTTGVSKGAILTYQNHFWGAMASAMQLGLSISDKWLVPMPLFHVGGMGVLMRCLIYGTTVVIHHRFEPELVNRAIDEDGVTLVSVVPAMLRRMLEQRTHPYPSTLRSVLLGGSAAPKGLLMRAHEQHVPVNQSYGLTETNTQATTLMATDALRKVGSSGKPLANLRLAILGPSGLTTDPHVEGEIAVQGPTVIQGYLNQPVANAKSFRDGWFYTGDIGVLDDEGYLYVLDRRSDLIVSGGENIYPAEIESVLTDYEPVVEAAVVGQTNATWGQVPVAFVVTQASLDVDAILAHCQKQLASYKVPKAFYRMDVLPRNASGKLLRRELKERLNNERDIQRHH